MAQYLIPSCDTVQPFGKIVVSTRGSTSDIHFTILMEPEGREAEGWQTGVALDASASMRSWYGRALEGKVPPALVKEYQDKGWVDVRTEDGRKVRSFLRQAYDDAIGRGHLKFSTNIIEPLAREFIAYLAGNLDADGGTTVLYWACGDGSGTEIVGDFTEEQCHLLQIQGPTSVAFGTGTKLVPAVKYFVDRFQDAPRGMYIFITDGKLDDLDSVKQCTRQLASEIAAHRRNAIKCVLIGVGNEINEGQMEELDNLDTGTEVDIWDHKVAREMRGLVEIFAEVVSENRMVADTATVYDSTGRVAMKFADGLPAKASFSLPASSEWFELDVAGKRIRQSLLRVDPGERKQGG